jgi:hypothetical protein
MKTSTVHIVILRFFALLLFAACLLPQHSHAQTPGSGSGASGDERFWIQTDYLRWWMKGNKLPPLVTSSPPGTNGTLPGSTVLFGGKSIDTEGRNGGRVSLGYWLDSEHRVGLDAGLILLGFNDGTHFSAASNGTPVLARPFFNTQTGTGDALLIAAPGITTGAISADSGNRLQSGSIGLRRIWRRRDGYHVDVVGGYRYFRFQDTLTIANTEEPTSPVVPAGTVISGMDRFAANNTFHAGEVGLEGGWHWGRWSLDLAGRVALGDLNNTGTIAGATQVNSSAGNTTFVGDLLALSSNIGKQSKDSFAVLPQVNATGRYSLGKVSVSLGYTFLYLNGVVRTGGQIDENVNPTLLPPATGVGTPSPQPQLHRGSFWAQGLSVGLRYRF